MLMGPPFPADKVMVEPSPSRRLCTILLEIEGYLLDDQNAMTSGRSRWIGAQSE